MNQFAFSMMCVVSLAFCAAARAQTPDAQGPDELVIVVQGEARARHSAPVSAQTLGAEAIVRLDLDTLDAVAVAAPGLSMINDQDPGTNIVAMRGVTTDRLQQAAIAYVLDGVPLADTEFFTAPLMDLARIDVLRGPQGALYGKSAAGGAVEITTRSADDPRAHVALAIGNGGVRESDGAAGFALGDWRVRAAGRWYAADGWIRNRTLNRIVDAEESRALRVRAAGPLFGGALDATLFTLEEDGGAAWASSNDVIGDFNGVLKGAALTDPIGDYEGRSVRQWVQGAARYTASLGPAATMRLLLARDAYRKRWDEELDYRPGALTFFGAPLFPSGLQPIRQPTDIKATTAELRISQTLAGAGDLTWGVFLQDIDRDRVDDFGPLLFGAAPPAYETDTRQTAAFVGYGMRGEAFTLDINLRADADRRTQVIRNSLSGARLDARTATFTRAQPRIAGSIRATDNTWLYASYGEGFRSGGFNPAPGPTSIWRTQFEPEVTRSLEIGAKHDADGLRIEATAFAAAIDDYQNYTFLDGNSVTLNVDRVDVRGGELSVQHRDIDLAAGRLDVGLGIAYADSKIGRYSAPDPLIAGATRNYAGKRVPNAPLWSGALSADWRRDLNEANSIDVGATLNATGETFFEIDNRLRAPAKQWLDLRASVRFGDTRVSLLARNATDERWAISAFGQTMLPLLAGLGPDGPFDTFTLNRGRQVRLELRREF